MACGGGGCLSTRDRAQSGGVSGPGTGHRVGVSQDQGQGTEWGCLGTTDRAQRRWGCLSTRYRAHRGRGWVGVCVSAPGRGVSAPGTGHRGGCVSTRDRAWGGVLAPGTGHTVGGVSAPATGCTGLYLQARGNEPESSKMLRAAGVGHSCPTAIVSAAATDSGLAVCRAWTPAQPRGWRCPGCSSRCGSQACPIPPASQSLTSASVFSS